MVDSDMDISGDSDNEFSMITHKRRQDCTLQPSISVAHEVVSQIPMPPQVSAPSNEQSNSSQRSDSGKRYLSLKKRWLQNIEKEPKKRKVSLEAYRKRHVSGGESGESGRSPSDIDNPSSHLQLDVKKDHRLAREERDRQSGKKLQKMTISDLVKRKIKLEEALRKIESPNMVERKPPSGNVEAKCEFDKFMEKQSRWLQRRARQKQREAKLEHFNSSVDMAVENRNESPLASAKLVSPAKRHSSSRIDREHRKHEKPIHHHRYHHHHRPHEKPPVGHPTKQKQVAVVRPRGQSELTSTLLCLQRAKEEVQRQLSLLKSPSDNSCPNGASSAQSDLTDTPVKPHSSKMSDV